MNMDNTYRPLAAKLPIRSLYVLPWKVTNLLPFPVTIYTAVTGFAPINRNMTLMPREVKTISNHANGSPLGEGQYLFFFYIDTRITSTKDGSPHFLVGRIELHEERKNILIGDISYTDLGDTQFVRLDAHIPFLRIINYLPFELEVHFRGAKVAEIPKFNTQGYFGGGTNEIYFNAGGDGMRIGDKMTFRVKGFSQPYLTATLMDNFMRNLHVGRVTDDKGVNLPDIYGYEAENPVTTGITYYVNTKSMDPNFRHSQIVNAYSTRPTQPFAAM